jgi:hypothetical protein
MFPTLQVQKSQYSSLKFQTMKERSIVPKTQKIKVQTPLGFNIKVQKVDDDQEEETAEDEHDFS